MIFFYLPQPEHPINIFFYLNKNNKNNNNNNNNLYVFKIVSMESPIIKLVKLLDIEAYEVFQSYKCEKRINPSSGNEEYFGEMKLSDKITTYSSGEITKFESFNQCALKLYDILNNIPSQKKSKTVFKAIDIKDSLPILIMISIFLNIVLFSMLAPWYIRSIITPFSLIIFLILTIPYLLNKNCIISQVIGREMIARTELYLNELDMNPKVLDFGDYILESQLDYGKDLYDKSGQLCTITQGRLVFHLDDPNIKLFPNEERIYKALDNLGLTVTKSGVDENGSELYSATLKLKKGSTILHYQNNQIPKNCLVFEKIPYRKVFSKLGSHYLAIGFSKKLTIDSAIEKHRIITMMYLQYFYNSLLIIFQKCYNYHEITIE